MDTVQSEIITEEEKLRYKAFISYRHLPLDKEAAERIQKSIEHYVLPKEFREAAGGKKLGRVFRDEDELPLSANLSDSITYALDNTEFLIVICTPDLPKSRWCEQEIRYFLKTHDRDHILAVLVDGSPEESFSPYLLHTFDEDGSILTDIEPLAANIAGPGHTIDNKAFKKEMTRIRAAILGVPFDSLWQREKRSRLTRIAAAMAVGLAGLAIFLGITLSQNSQIRQKNQEISEQKDQIEQNLNEITEKNTQIQKNLDQIHEQNEQILSQNEEISQKNRHLEKQMSSMLIDTAYSLLNEYNVRQAAENALKSVESKDPSIYDHRADRLFINVLGAYTENGMRSEMIYRQSTDIVDLVSDSEGSRAYIADLVGNICCIDQESGRLLWSAPSVIGAVYEAEAPTRLFMAEEYELLICKNYHNVAALSLLDGSLVWNYVYTNGNTFFAISNDSSQIALFDRSTLKKDADPSGIFTPLSDYNNQTDIVLLNTGDGSVKGQRTLVEDEEFRIIYSPTEYYGASFSEEGNMLACVFAYRNLDSYGTGHYEYILIDTGNTEQLRRGKTFYSLASKEIIYGIAIDEDTMSMLTAQYNDSYGGIIVLAFHGDTNTIESYLYEQSLGTAMADLSLVVYQPMICSDDLAVFCSADTVYILNRYDGTLRKSFKLSGSVLDIGWLDREEEAFSLITGGGMHAVYDLKHDDGWVDFYAQNKLSQTSIAKARRVRGGYSAYERFNSYDIVPNGGYLTVPADALGHLIRVENFKDPHKQTISLPEDTYSSRVYFCPSPSRERFFVLSGGKEEWVLSAYETGSASLIAQNSFPKSSVFDSVNSIDALDEDRILAGLYIIPLEGDPSPLGALKDYTSQVRNYLFQSCRLYNGQLLTLGDLQNTSFLKIPFNYVGLDGKTVMAINEVGNRMMFKECSVLKAGANGYVLGYGSWKWIDPETSTLHTEDTPAYVLFDALGEKRYIVQDAQQDAKNRIVAMGSRNPVFVCGDDLGKIMLYNIPEGTSFPLDYSYVAGEIMDLALFQNDELLLILSKAGRIDIRSVKSGELLHTENVSAIRNNIRYGAQYVLNITEDTEHERIYIRLKSSGSNVGTMISIDTSSWSTVFSFGNDYYLGFNTADGRIYGYNRGLFSFPAYSLQDLTEWAEEYLTSDLP